MHKLLALYCALHIDQSGYDDTLPTMTIPGVFHTVHEVCRPVPLMLGGHCGYTGSLVFVKLSCGYIILFLVRHKSELMNCARRLAKNCTQFDHSMRALRTDMRTVVSPTIWYVVLCCTTLSWSVMYFWYCTISYFFYCVVLVPCSFVIPYSYCTVLNWSVRSSVGPSHATLHLWAMLPVLSSSVIRSI